MKKSEDTQAFALCLLPECLLYVQFHSMQTFTSYKYTTKAIYDMKKK